MRTRREIEQHVANLGGDPAIAAFLGGLDAGARHQARVGATVEAAANAAKRLIEAGGVTSPDGGTPSTEAVAEMVIALDLIGVGGSGDAEGLGTDRLPCFSTLGKGRKQARDGAAWMAALEAALPAASPWGVFTVLPGESRLAWKSGGEVVVFNPKLANAVIPLRWLIAAVRRAAWAASCQEGGVLTAVNADTRFIDTVTSKAWIGVHASLMAALNEDEVK